MLGLKNHAILQGSGKNRRRNRRESCDFGALRCSSMVAQLHFNLMPSSWRKSNDRAMDNFEDLSRSMFLAAVVPCVFHLTSVES